MGMGEYCKTGKFHVMKISRIRGVGRFATGLQISWCRTFLANVKHYIFATENFRKSADFHENFLFHSSQYFWLTVSIFSEFTLSTNRKIHLHVNPSKQSCLVHISPITNVTQWYDSAVRLHSTFEMLLCFLISLSFYKWCCTKTSSFML